MARDYRHGAPRRETYQRSSQRENSTAQAVQIVIPNWFWGLLVVFTLVAAFAIFKHFSNTDRSIDSQSSAIYQNAAKEAVAANGKEVEQQETVAKPGLVAEENSEEGLRLQQVDEFSFYADLAQAEIFVDVEPLPIELPEPVWIQAGSFREKEQAEREQIRLGTVGLNVDIRLSESGRFYQIISGPYTNKLELNKLRSRFQRMGADTQVVSH